MCLRQLVSAPMLEKTSGAAQMASLWRWRSAHRKGLPRAAPTIAAPVSAARRKICLSPIPHLRSGLPGDCWLHPHHLGANAGATGLRNPVPALTVLPLVHSLPCRDGRVAGHAARLLAPSERRGATVDAPWGGAQWAGTKSACPSSSPELYSSCNEVFTCKKQGVPSI